MRLVHRPDDQHSDAVSNTVLGRRSSATADAQALVDHLLAEQDRVIQQLDALDLEIQRVIAAQIRTVTDPAADAA